MQALNRFSIGIFACLFATSVQAGDVVLIQSLIPYASDYIATEDVRKECDWNATLPIYLAKASAGSVEVAQENFNTTAEKKLTLVASNLHTAGGGNWSGPKWLVLEGSLTQGKEVLGSFEARRQTIRGSMRGCKTLISLSEDIAKDILKWLKAPSLNAKLGDAK